MKNPTVLRKRFIPPETIDISGDELIYRDDTVLITRWKTIKPRPDISVGISYTFLNEGYKISRFYDGKREFAFWYCDIVDVKYEIEVDTYTITDLLLDLKIMPDGTMNILDVDELADALSSGFITDKLACDALRILDKLVKMVNRASFPPEICRNEEYWKV